MFIVYGQRYYGRVGGYDGEYLTTKFAHVYWLPLVPISSMWVTRRQGDQLYGFDVSMSAKSVAAAYLRIWPLLPALLCIVTLTAAGFVIAAMLLALLGWSWMWRRAARGREEKRALFNRVAFGTACDPMQRPVTFCSTIRPDIEARFAEVSGGRTPEDVVRFGADTPRQAAFAYAVLRLVARTVRGSTAARAIESSEKILDGFKTSDAAALGDGPFRAEGTVVDRIANSDLEAAAEAVVSEREKALDKAIENDAEARTAAAWANSPENPAVKAEIAANKKKRAISNRAGVVIAVLAGIGMVGFIYWDHEREKAAAERGLTVLRQFRDDFCACTTRACAERVFDERMGAIKAAEKTVRELSSKEDDLERLAKEINDCAFRLAQ
jgi:hypothetical protein